MISIVIPIFNQQDTVHNTIQSALNQDYCDFEILVVDDGSTDSSADVVKKIQSSDSRIKIFQKKNGGVSSARNEGIRQAKSDFIAFLDADDLWEPNYLQEQVKLIKDFPNAEMWGIAWGIKQNNRKKNKKNNIPKNFRGIVTNQWPRDIHLFWTSAVVIHKPVLEKVDYFDESIRIGEDLDMWCRITLQFKVAFYNKILAFYNFDAENRAMKKMKPNLKYCLPYYMEKYNAIQYNKPDFVYFFHSYCAGFIIPYYFGTKEERSLSKGTLQKLNYSIIKTKYSLFYKTPYYLGFLIHFLFTFKNHVRSIILPNIQYK